jgi:glucose-6-phosphate 1-dehydrogenase
MRTATRRARYGAGSVADRQLPRYADEEGVDPSRGTETYAEVIFQVANWRWAGTPFRVRTGKAIGTERRDIAVHFKSVPQEPFDDRDRPNVLRFRLSPDAISLRLNLNGEGDPFDLEQVFLDTEFPTQDLPPYSLLLKEILSGDPTLSIRGDEAEELWRIVEPVLTAWADDEVPLEEYPAGSSGPSGAPDIADAPADAPRSTAAGDDPRSG